MYVNRFFVFVFLGFLFLRLYRVYGSPATVQSYVVFIGVFVDFSYLLFSMKKKILKILKVMPYVENLCGLKFMDCLQMY